jgi:hypothetical protein
MRLPIGTTWLLCGIFPKSRKRHLNYLVGKSPIRATGERSVNWLIYRYRRNAIHEAASPTSSDSRNLRFVIATRSLRQVLRVGLLNAGSEKRPPKHACWAQQSVLSSPICLGIIAIGRYSRISMEEQQTFLCSSDCLAERQTFEPSVQVIPLQVVNVCVGYAG